MKKLASYKIDEDVHSLVREFCESHGLKQGYFVEEALKEKIMREEALEDSLEFKKWKHQTAEAIDFSEYLKRRKK